MPNRYLGRDLANQRYLGRDVSSIRSFGRIIYPNAAIIGVYINTPTLTPNIADNFTLTANLVPIDADSPLPFTYQWFRDGVVIGTGVTSITNATNFAVTFTYRVEVTDGDGTVFVSPDIIIAVQAHIPILATLTYGTGISAVATGGTGTLLYAWTFAVDGIRFRLDNIQNAIVDGDLSYLPPLARTNAQRMSLSSVGIDVRNYFPGHTVSNVGLTMSDDNHDEFFPITDFSSFTTSNLTNQAYLGNWRNADFTSDTTSVFPFGGSIQTTGGISGGETPPGIIVENLAIADTNTLFVKDISEDGSLSEYGPYPIDGIGDDITVEDNARLHTIVYNGEASAVLNSLALFGITVVAISANPQSSAINVAIRQT